VILFESMYIYLIARSIIDPKVNGNYLNMPEPKDPFDNDSLICKLMMNSLGQLRP